MGLASFIKNFNIAKNLIKHQVSILLPKQRERCEKLTGKSGG